MATTVSAAFTQFRKDCVDLDGDEVASARASASFLEDQIAHLQGKVDGFPILTGKNEYFGSFARRTKIEPLDDIDVMIVLNGAGGVEQADWSDAHTQRVKVTSSESVLAPLADGEGYVSSNRVLFAMKAGLKEVSQYKAAELHKNKEAVTLSLKSYPWVFDIVPAFGVRGDVPLQYYVIPDGKGNWKRTDPRRDSNSLAKASAKHLAPILQAIRLIKYWNMRPSQPKLDSYFLESIAIAVFSDAPDQPTVQNALHTFFADAQYRILKPCSDPKGLGPDLESGQDVFGLVSVSSAMGKAAQSSLEAIRAEIAHDHKLALSHWANIFGLSFPTYG